MVLSTTFWAILFVIIGCVLYIIAAILLSTGISFQWGIYLICIGTAFLGALVINRAGVVGSTFIASTVNNLTAEQVKEFVNTALTNASIISAFFLSINFSLMSSSLPWDEDYAALNTFVTILLWTSCLLNTNTIVLSSMFMCAMSATSLEKVHTFCKVYAFHFCVAVFSTSLGIISMSFAYAVYSWGLNGLTSGVIGVIVTGSLIFIIPYWTNDLFIEQGKWIKIESNKVLVEAVQKSMELQRINSHPD